MATKIQMKRSIALHPTWFLAVTVLVLLSVAAVLIPLWINSVKRIEHEVKLIERGVNQLMVSNIDKTASSFSPLNSSAMNLVRILSSSLDESDLRFSIIQSKVAAPLFQAFRTTPYLSQISYIGLNGLFFAYYTEGGEPFALYSNSTFQNSTNGYTWFVQRANRDTGQLYGVAIKYPPSAVVDTGWYRNALNHTNGSVSVGTGWGSSNDVLLLSTAGMGGRSVISLGFSMRPMIDVLVARVDVYNGSLYLATKDGYVLTQGIPNTCIIMDGDRVSLHLVGSNGDQVNVADFTCNSHNGMLQGSVLDIWGRKYAIHCSPIEVAGLQLVRVLAMPSNEFSSIINKNIRVALVLLVIMIVFMVVMIFVSVYLVVGAARREMYLCGALIRQMEATQQSERKSMNKSLAFASASHDIRASLAGIMGLIEICRDIAASRKRDPFLLELLSNLSHMETCTTDLLGILNSILDTSKMEAGKMQLDEEEFNLEHMLEDVVDLYYPVGMKKGVDVILDPYDGSITKCSQVRGDRGKLKQILSNLLSNAVKFTSDGHVNVRAWTRKPKLENDIIAADGSMTMNCLFCLKIERTSSNSEDVNNIRRDPNCVEIVFEVSDTGEGIPKEKQKSVFENYVQVKESAQEGTGLGLGIVQSLVRLMGGEIGIVDKNVGYRGTCFRFNVFLSTCEADVSAKASTTVADIEANGDYVSSDSYQHSGPTACVLSPRMERSQVMLFIQNPKRSGVLQDFLQRLGLKVHVVRHPDQLASTLKRINRKLNLSQCSSSNNSRSEGLGSRASSTWSKEVCTRSKEIPLSAWDGTDNVLPSQKKANSHGGPFSFVLLVIDTRAAPFPETCRAISEFRADLNENCSSRVVWLYEPNMSSSSLHELDEDKLPPSDLIISKPFHGPRLYQTVALLPEFGGTVPRREENLYRLESASLRNKSSARTSTSSRSGVKGKCPVEGVGIQKGEIEEHVELNCAKPLTGKRILVVDDDPIGRKIAVSVASQLGANTVSCENGEEAWKLVCTRLHSQVSIGASEDSVPFDCILMDCQMPVMDGIEATGRIRDVEGRYGVHTPMVALTAHKEGEERDRMKQAGVDRCLTKPLNKDKILRAMYGLNIRS